MNNTAAPRPYARPLGALWAEHRAEQPYDVVIVGSGYGGAVAAAGLAGCTKEVDGQAVPLRVCVLERGRHYRPGEFPSRLGELPGHVRLAEQTNGRVRGNHQGLLDVRLGDDVMALVGNGLGGGSLINAGVLLQPDAGDFDRAPQQWRDLLATLERGHYFERALRELGGEVVEQSGQRVPNTIALHPHVSVAHPLAKTKALHTLAGAAPVRLAPITVAMAPGANLAGVALERCTLCGDCMTGCNVGAKNSLDVNLLHRAWQAGADLYTGATVVSIKREVERKNDGHWVLRVAHSDPALQAREKELLFVHAHHVILAAGSLGSSEILLRSRGDKLNFSGRLGEGFSCNGDNIAAVHRMPQPVHGSADEDLDGDQRRVGPTITATFAPQAGPRAFQVQEFAVPGPLKRLFDEVITTAHALHALPEPDRSCHGGEADDAIDPLAVNPEFTEHTLLVGLVGHDDAAGALRLPQPLRPREGPAQTGVVTIHWPGARDAPAVNAPQARLRNLVERLGRPATLIANPLWRLLPPALERLVTQPRGPVFTVHPLGGCAIGGSAADGVVDDEGCVFDAVGAHEDRWQGSLLVVDGAAMPGSLGVNPALTITAVAMHAIERLRERKAWRGGIHFGVDPQAEVTARLRVDPPAVPPPLQSPAAETEIGVIERLSGPVWLDVGAALPRRCMVELTLAYESVAVRRLMSTLKRSVQVDTGNDATRLRIYDYEVWKREHLRVASDSLRQRFLCFEARLHGELRFLHREASRPWRRRLRSLWAWLLNRGSRDIYQELKARRALAEQARRAGRTPDQPASPDGEGAPQTAGEYLRALFNLASRAGEVRCFEYDLTLGAVLINQFVDDAKRPLPGPPMTGTLSGSKRLTYNRRANPWLQLTLLELNQMPGMRDLGAPVLRLDPGFMAGVGVPLLRITRQRDQVSALAELASFGLHFARVLLYTHLWTFRKPDAPRSTAAPQRLPGPVGGSQPQITELVVDRLSGSDEPVTIRLSRYLPERAAAAPPLVMIHGYSVSGNTFTHETLQPSAAEFFRQRGRDVWVVDLRTSAGLPSATLPWAFEQAALIDIPAALMHVRAVTGRRVDVLAHCIGCAMLGMAILSDASEVRTNELQLGVDTRLVSEHLGLLGAFNGTDRDGGEHPCIHRVVLSQKGPVLRYTDANVLRAFLMQSIRRVVLSDDFQFRPPARPTVSDELLDRFLSSLPYPKEDYDVENPFWPCAVTGWTATRHRMDALYGRDFDAANMSPETLDAIDDLFGPINLDTVSQTSHFARFCAITNQAGRAEFVTRERLRKRWGGIPTLALHGADNGLADVDTQRLLERHLKGAGVPFTARIYPEMGHQDVLIGNQSARVFEDIDRFLGAAEPPAKVRPLPSPVFDAPWAGPRIAALEQQPQNGAPLRLAVLPRPDQGRARLGLIPGRWRIGSRRFETIDAPYAVARGELDASSRWLFAQPELAALAAAHDGADDAVQGWFAVLVYDVGETTAFEQPAWVQALGAVPAEATEAPRRSQVARQRGSVGASAPKQPAGGTASVAVLPPAQFEDDHDEQPLEEEFDKPDAPAARRAAAAAALRPPVPPPPWTAELLLDAAAWLRVQPDAALRRCFVRLADLRRVEAHRAAGSAQPSFAFTLASCQYPYGLVDRGLASASFDAMQHMLHETDLALLVGDQIYADATAGLLDATRRDERYDAPHDRALRVPGLRAVMRRVPVLMLPDDHELSDNWEPLAPAARQERPRAHEERDEARVHGMQAFFKYQRMKNDVDPEPPAADLLLHYAGYPFYLIDTRSRRSARGATVAAGDVQLLDETQWAQLQQWLLAHRDAVKFVATAGLLLPRRRVVADDPSQADTGDAWDGYPLSLHRLLDFMAANTIRNTVFLSGDEHHALVGEVWLAPGKVKLVSVHASALYAPYPFANGRPQDLVQQETIPAPQHFRAQAKVRATFAPPGDGFARIELRPGGLRVSFHKAAGGSLYQDIALNDAAPF